MSINRRKVIRNIAMCPLYVGNSSVFSDEVNDGKLEVKLDGWWCIDRSGTAKICVQNSTEKQFIAWLDSGLIAINFAITFLNGTELRISRGGAKVATTKKGDGWRVLWSGDKTQPAEASIQIELPGASRSEFKQIDINKCEFEIGLHVLELSEITNLSKFPDFGDRLVRVKLRYDANKQE